MSRYTDKLTVEELQARADGFGQCARDMAPVNQAAAESARVVRAEYQQALRDRQER